MPKHPLVARSLAILSTSLLISLPMLAADDGMKVTDNGYLDTRGFSVILYQSTYHPVFVDQKNTAASSQPFSAPEAAASDAAAPYWRFPRLVVNAQRSSGTPEKFPSISCGPSLSE